ncbi:DUF6943 family protein [Chondrinema litorale]|uniref:DUF6943 family protein n=1 Tax=Chondrinema litorale TaxID=2994555 RepID=UPI002543CD2B|nr:hypothetical protein [Chondrinema litorale]UZR99631.1 hypothetical protein OQ292_37210 [Chondrinema litorale]
MYLIQSYSVNSSLQADFYIQSKGVNAGKPMREPSANCFIVLTDRSQLLPDYFYYMVLAAFNTGIFRKYLSGSVIPFLTQKDFSKALLEYYKRGG